MRGRFRSKGMRVASALLAGLVLGGAIYRNFVWTGCGSVAQDDQVAAAITQLRSGNVTAREAAKEALLQQGSEAVERLVAALQELFLDPKPHFDLGNEAEGAEELRRLNDLPVNERTPSEYLLVDITWRLERDIIELLGRLHDKAAVPLLIELTRKEMHTSQNEYLRPPMKALVEIGKPGVPKIVEALVSVPSTEAAALSTCCPNLTDAQRRAIIESEQQVMIARLAIVLGEIRDERALPVLEKLITPPRGRNSYAFYYLKTAIEKIKGGAK
jgi:HEAT repeat protein